MDCPSPPRNLKAKEITKNYITLSWESPQHDGGSVVSHYVVEKKDTTKMMWATVNKNVVRNTVKVN